MWSGMCHPRKCGTRICCRLSRVSGYRGSGMSFGQRTDNGWTFSRGCQEGSRRQVRWGSLYRGRYRAYGISCGSMMLVPSTAVSDPPQRRGGLVSRLTQQAALASRLTRQAALASRHKQLSDSASNGNLCRLICLHFQTRRLPNGTARPSTRAKSPRRHHHRKSADITICMLRVNPAS